MATLGASTLDVHPLCLGGNVFGWSADADASRALLDAYADAGGNFVDTADVYMLEGGESETIIGGWLAASGRRDAIVLATKVGKKKDRLGQAAATIHAAADESLQRLRTDRIDLYYAHADDPDTPLEESLGAYDELVRAGKVRYVGLSNFAPDRLDAALDVCEREGFAVPVALQPEYNLVERAAYEDGLQEVCARRGLACVPYFALAKGFLTGKYRPGGDKVESVRAEGAEQYLDARGERVLAALDAIAAAHDTSQTAVSLAWLRDRPTVVAPIASARTGDQLRDLLAMADVRLTDAEREQLDAASA